jgi:hypothetical protein
VPRGHQWGTRITGSSSLATGFADSLAAMVIIGLALLRLGLRHSSRSRPFT